MLGEIPFCLKTGKPASLGAKLRLIRQMYACQTSRGGKKPWKNINTDGKERADLQETMRSDSSAVSSTPDLAAGPKGARSAAKSASPEADVALLAVCRKSRCPACNSASGFSKKDAKTHSSACLCSITSSLDFRIMREREKREKKTSVPIRATQTFIWPWSVCLTKLNYCK